MALFCGDDAELVSCYATVLPSSVLLGLLLLVLMAAPMQCCKAKASPILAVSAVLGIATMVSALLVEPWLWSGAGKIGSWPPPLPGVIGGSCAFTFYLLLPFVTASKPHRMAALQATAALARCVPLVIGFGGENSFNDHWLAWLPLEAALLIGAVAAVSCTAAINSAAATSTSESLLPASAPLRHSGAAAGDVEGGTGPLNAARLIANANHGGINGNGHSGRHATAAAHAHAFAPGGSTMRVAEVALEDELRPGADGERVLPRGVSCVTSLVLFHGAHTKLMEEAKAIQGGKDVRAAQWAGAVEEGNESDEEAAEADARRVQEAMSEGAEAGADATTAKDTPPRHDEDGDDDEDEEGHAAAGGGGGGGGGGGDAPLSPAEALAVLRRHLWRLCPKAPLLFGGLSSIVLTAASFGAPYVQGRLFDAAVNAYHNGTASVADAFSEDIAPLLGVMGGLYGLTWAMEISVGILFAVAAHTALTRLRIAMFANLVQQDTAFYDRHTAGELSSRLINDSGQLQALTQFVTQNALQGSVRVIGGLATMYATHPTLALLATVVTPLNWYIIRRAGKVQGLYGVVQNHAMAGANAAAVETLGAMRTVHANTGELGEARRFARSIRRFLRVVLVTVHTQTMVIFTQLLLSKGRDVLLLGVGMREVVGGSLSIGAFAAFTQYVQYFEDGFSSLANIWLQTKQTLISAGRFVQLLERKPSIRFGVGARGARPGGAPCTGELEMRGVSFGYPASGGAQVLRAFELHAPPGSVVALVGASGAGKSTVARLIERFYDPQTGSVMLDGVDFRALDVRWLRQQIGFVEQEVRGGAQWCSTWAGDGRHCLPSPLLVPNSHDAPPPSPHPLLRSHLCPCSLSLSLSLSLLSFSLLPSAIPRSQHCSIARLRPTSATAVRTRAPRRCAAHASWPTRMSLCAICRWGTGRRRARGACASRAARSSGWRLHALCSSSRACCSSTRPPPRSTPPTRPSSRPPSIASWWDARLWSSRIGSRALPHRYRTPPSSLST